jgi:hypothetical protein
VQAFNCPTITHHFDLLEAIIEKYDIPTENIYNMDEKGIQWGGGHKAQAQKYFVPHSKCPKYKLRSANFELVTIVEYVTADGGFKSYLKANSSMKGHGLRLIPRYQGCSLTLS